jgi:DNA-binding transcriptional LysR family regulator
LELSIRDIRSVVGSRDRVVRHLNYSHLPNFWTVASEGSIVRAAEVLQLIPQTISGQVKLLEESVGEPLLQRNGGGVALTITAKLVRRYAQPARLSQKSVCRSRRTEMSVTS